MAARTEKFMVRVTEAEHFDILKASGKRNSSEYLRKCEKFYRSFNPDFLAQIEKAAEISKQDVPTVIQQLLLVYMGQDLAINQELGPTKTWARAFSYDSSGRLVTGDELSDRTAAEVKTAVRELKKKLESMKDRKVDNIVISRREATLMSASL